MLKLKILSTIILSIFITACQNNQTIENSLSPAKISINIPQSIPQYPQGRLVNFEASNHSELITILWEVNENNKVIKSYYQEKLQQDNWEIITPFSQAENQTNNNNILVAQKDDFKLKISLLSTSPTQFTLEYKKGSSELITSDTINNENISTPTPTPTPTTSITPSPEITTTPTPTPSENTSSTQTFEDINELNENFKEYIENLNELGIFIESDITENNKFNPNEAIKKRDFVRWLVNTNNKIYKDDNTKKIRLDSPNSELAFRDILPSDPDFKVIQGLAETGIIPSPLIGENNPDLFYPDQPLTREELILWKVYFDLHKALPKADLTLIEETWGFQDAAKINPQVFNALYADFQNEKYSNIRRIFGYTTLFQPQKTVTRAEASAALGYFGTDNKGISLTDFLDN